MAGTLFSPTHADVVARFRCLLSGADGACGPPVRPLPHVLDDFRSFYACRAADERFTWPRFAEIVSDELVAPLAQLVADTCATLAADGVPAGWRADDEAQRIVEGSRRVAAAARRALAEGRVAEAVALLVEVLADLAAAVRLGRPAAAATRDAMRRLLPLFGCVAPVTSARAWAILGLRGRPAERFADGSLVDEPAPAWPSDPLFPAAVLDLLARSREEVTHRAS